MFIHCNESDNATIFQRIGMYHFLALYDGEKIDQWRAVLLLEQGEQTYGWVSMTIWFTDSTYTEILLNERGHIQLLTKGEW